MAFITSLLAGVTRVAPYVDPIGTGVLAACLPFIGTILVMFTQLVINASAVRQILRGMVNGLLALAVSPIR